MSELAENIAELAHDPVSHEETEQIKAMCEQVQQKVKACLGPPTP